MNKIEDIVWKHGYKSVLGVGCDFKGNDIKNVRSDENECKYKCLSTKNCTHFSWSNGVCYKKSGLISRQKASIRTNYVCGIIEKSKSFNFLILIYV